MKNDKALIQAISSLKWTDAVNECVQHYGKTRFSLSEFNQRYRRVLKIRFPKNDHIEAGVRREFQNLRDAEILEFVDNNGNYRCLDFVGDSDWDNLVFESFLLALKPKPNLPVNELADSQPQQEFHMPNYLQRRAELGEAGEKAVIAFEKSNLIKLGLESLANSVEQVSKTIGDHAGYDIRSYWRDGEEKWIEVKTTTGRATKKFNISEYQISTSEKNPSKYHLYRLYNFQTLSQTADYFALSGNLRPQLATIPTEYLAYPR